MMLGQSHHTPKQGIRIPQSHLQLHNMGCSNLVAMCTKHISQHFRSQHGEPGVHGGSTNTLPAETNIHDSVSQQRQTGKIE
jgi:hypothetical protein